MGSPQTSAASIESRSECSQMVQARAMSALAYDVRGRSFRAYARSAQARAYSLPYSEHRPRRGWWAHGALTLPAVVSSAGSPVTMVVAPGCAPGCTSDLDGGLREPVARLH